MVCCKGPKEGKPLQWTKIRAAWAPPFCLRDFFLISCIMNQRSHLTTDIWVLQKSSHRKSNNGVAHNSIHSSWSQSHIFFIILESIPIQVQVSSFCQLITCFDLTLSYCCCCCCCFALLSLNDEASKNYLFLRQLICRTRLMVPLILSSPLASKGEMLLSCTSCKERSQSSLLFSVFDPG